MALSPAVRISSMALRLLFVIQLLLGIFSWINRPLLPIGVHMVIGLLIVALVWFLGVAQGLLKNGSIGLTLGTFIMGLVLAIFGMVQGSILNGPHQPHGIIQVIHLLLALATVGLGEASVSRFRRGASAAAPAA